MAKYDTYTLAVRLENKKSEISLSLGLIFEDEDDVNAVIAQSRAKLRTEISLMKASDFVDVVED